MSPSVRFCLRLFAIIAVVMTLVLLPAFIPIEAGADASFVDVLREAALYGTTNAALMTLLLGGLHVIAVRRALGHAPSVHELGPASTCAVTVTATPTAAAAMVRAAVSTLPDARITDEDARAGRIHVRLPGGWRTWGTRVEILLLPAGHADTTAVITARPVGIALVDYGASLIATRQIAERLGSYDVGPLRASA